MRAFAVGQSINIRPEHADCDWCAPARGRRGTVRNVTRSELRTTYYVDVDLSSGSEPVLLPFKAECLEAVV